jgi:hypothetical protein
MNKISFNRPIRIRSKVCVLLYKNCSLDILRLKLFLENRFTIKSEDRWNYILKFEKVGDEIDILVFLEFVDVPDVYSSRLTLPDIGLEPSIWCFHESTFPLYALLKFYNIKEYEENVVTNMDKKILDRYVTITNYAITTENPREPGTVTTNVITTENLRKPLTPKQHNQIKHYINKISQLIEEDTKDSYELTSARTNLRNYLNRNLEIPETLEKEIKLSCKQVSDFVSSKKFKVW